ncbi:hypothetical protein [Flavobacterium sp. J27]|uniref:hypothetical protein n=1 Tax=Flavobacterium sp. J27 TaxID=2060419 RepID=UPI001030144C|nr:hypothetical protein [Flavobacterium sp. J27]
MDKFRVYVDAINAKRKKENQAIAKHNEECKTITLNEAQQTLKTVFLKKYKTYSATNYNKEVEVFMEEKGIVLPKKKLHIIKYPTELVFQNILHEYAQQLKQHTKVVQDLGIMDERPLKMLEINSVKIAQLERNGIKSIPVTNETIKNHRKHLIDAGVFFDYTFCGHKRGVKVHLNPEILVVLDLKTEKLTTLENQLVTTRTAKSFGNTKEVTVTQVDNTKIKENVNNNSLEKGTASPDPSFAFYSNTTSQLNDFQTRAAAKTVKVSENLEKLIEDKLTFCNNLAQGVYNNWIPIDIRCLHLEAKQGTISREEFKELHIQEQLKSLAKLYKNSNSKPYFGSWLKAYDLLLQYQFLNPNGHLYHKDLMVDKQQEYRWRINHANKWFTKTGVRPLFPHQYLDPTRTTPKEVGFAYTKKAFLKHKKDIQDRMNTENVIILNAKKRKERINYAKKFDLVIRRFMNNRLSLNDTFDYIKNNLPEQYQTKFTEKLLNYSIKTIKTI